MPLARGSSALPSVLFWKKVTKAAQSYDIDEPHVPRKRKRPKRYDDGSSSGDLHFSTIANYVYFEAIDVAVNSLKNRFDQPGYQLYSNLEQLLIKACQGKTFEEELEFISSFYKDDLDKELLQSEITIFDIRDYLQSLSSAQRGLLDQVCRVLILILVMPSTNATSERSFSALRRVKTYLRITTTQKRLTI